MGFRWPSALWATIQWSLLPLLGLLSLPAWCGISFCLDTASVNRWRIHLLLQWQAGQLDIDDPIEGDGTVKVFGWERKRQLTDTKTRYSASFGMIRFRASGLFRIRIEAIEIDLRAAAKGNATLSGQDFIDPGKFSVDANSFCTAAFQAMPDGPKKFVISGDITPQ